MVIFNLVCDGVFGLVVCGSVGENILLIIEEKMVVIEVVKDVFGGCVLVICGIVEFISVGVVKVVKVVEWVGVDGIMVMLVLVYFFKLYEIVEYFCSVVSGIDLLVMVYNNLLIYWNDVILDILVFLVDCENIVCFKDSFGDICCFIDVCNQVGECFIFFVGFDDVVLESVVVGVQGWILGMFNVFLKEGEIIFCLVRVGCFVEVMLIYEWLMLIFYFDVCFDLVQCIKFCE